MTDEAKMPDYLTLKHHSGTFYSSLTSDISPVGKPNGAEKYIKNKIPKLNIHILLDAIFSIAGGKCPDPETCEVIEAIADSYDYPPSDWSVIYNCGAPADKAPDAGEQEKADQDARLYGQSFMKEGKRIDPNDVYIHPPAGAGDRAEAFAVMPDANDTPEAFKDWVRGNWQTIEAALTPPDNAEQLSVAIDVLKKKIEYIKSCHAKGIEPWEVGVSHNTTLEYGRAQGLEMALAILDSMMKREG